MKPIVALTLEEAVLVSRVLSKSKDKEVTELNKLISKRIDIALGTTKKD